MLLLQTRELVEGSDGNDAVRDPGSECLEDEVSRIRFCRQWLGQRSRASRGVPSRA
jgi:hypothetical protein